MKIVFATHIVFAAWSVWAGSALAQDETEGPLAKGIQDNSFLIEEAYNQEPGVVQHITNVRRQGRDWSFVFTQEWPLGSQDHQFSYTLPYSVLGSMGQRTSGAGDLLLNYRFQALYESRTTPAFAPRLSLVLPTGSAPKGTGDGSFGYQVNLPFSKIVGDRLTLHANAGLTELLDVDGRRPTSLNLGGSLVYAATRDLNFLLEAVGERSEIVNAARKIERENTLIVSPGARYALNLTGAQLVAGIGAPITANRGKVGYGAIFYFSLEHKYRR